MRTGPCGGRSGSDVLLLVRSLLPGLVLAAVAVPPAGIEKAEQRSQGDTGSSAASPHLSEPFGELRSRRVDALIGVQQFVLHHRREAVGVEHVEVLFQGAHLEAPPFGQLQAIAESGKAGLVQAGVDDL